MKKAINTLIIIVLLATVFVAGRDYFTFKEKQRLYDRSVMYDEELVALSKVLTEMKQLGKKYIILKKRKIDDGDREALLKEIEDLLSESENIAGKFYKVLTHYNSVAIRYNELPQQILWFKSALPSDLKIKTGEDYLSM